MRILTLFSLFLFSNGILAQDSISTKPKFAGIPIISYNRTQDLCLGGMASVFYKVNREDTISPSSNSGVIGMYTTQGSYFVMGFQQLYISQDRWRIQAAAGVININFQVYLENPFLSTGNFVDYNTKATLGVLEVQRKVYKRIYGGVSGAFVKSETQFDIPSIENDSVTESNLNFIGYVISNDSRDHVQYPSKGIFLNFKNQFYREWTGSDYEFDRFIISYNQFFSVQDEKKILAFRANFNIATGDVPFEGQSVVGSDDIRGYSQGRYRGNQVYTLQSEYRWSFAKRFGMVAFFGVASAVDKFSEISESQVLPGIGAGIRFRMIPSEKVNIGIDGAIGRDDYSITFRIGEAFAR